MSARLGALMKAERDRRGWSQSTFALKFHDAGLGEIDPSHVSLLERGKRDSDPQLWSTLWRFLDLPWTELYREWGLPLPNEAQGEDAEVVEISRAVSRLDSPRRQVVSRFVQSLDYIVEPIVVTKALDTNSKGTLNSAAPVREGVPNAGIAVHQDGTGRSAGDDDVLQSTTGHLRSDTGGGESATRPAKEGKA